MITDIGPAAATTSRTSALPTPGGNLGKEEFLKMLVAQLRNQDPMNPMNGDDMAAQLAHFSSLEQLTNISAQLDVQAGLHHDIIGSINDTTAMNALGKTVLAVGDQVVVGEDGEGSVHFEVGGQGGMATLKIYNEAGEAVGSRPLGFVSSGRHEFELDSAATEIPPGTYRYAIEVVDAAGKPVPAQPFVSCLIDGVRYSANGPVLTSGSIRIPFGTILQITTG